MSFDLIGRGTVDNDGTGDSAKTGAAKINALISAANAGQFQSFRNAIINGAFNVWQRGTSFSSITSAAFFADRWFYEKSGAMVHDVSRSTDVPTVAQAGQLFNYSALVDCTTVDAAIAATDYCFIEQRVEGFNYLPLAQRQCILSFWVKATKTGIYCASISNSGQNRSYVGEYTVNVADTWEFKTVVITASPSAGTWDYATGIGIRVRFVLACGSTFQTTANAWAGGQYFATANQVNACDNTANNFRITGVQLEACDSTEQDYTPFEHVPYGVELARCQRYYERLGASVSTLTEFAMLHCISTTQARGRLGFRVSKRATPTITIGSATSFAVDAAGGTQVACTALSGQFICPDSCDLLATVASGLVAGNVGTLRANSSSAPVVEISSEL